MEPKIFIDLANSMKGKVSINKLCSLFQISRSSYYRWSSKSNLGELTELELQIKNLCFKNKFRYGYRKIAALLNRTTAISKNTVQRIMQKYGWTCKVKIKKRKKIGQPFKVFENKLNRKFYSEKRFKKLVTDITYLPFGRKQLYLSSIMDLYNGEIVAYSIGEKQDVSFVLDTLNQLPKTTDCLLHSDQGSVYTSYSYQKEISRKRITMSMSRKGTPSDNACIESFHASLKSETFYLEEFNYEPTSIVIQTVIDYIKYYNKTRIQQKLGYKSPIEYRKSTA